MPIISVLSLLLAILFFISFIMLIIKNNYEGSFWTFIGCVILICMCNIIPYDSIYLPEGYGNVKFSPNKEMYIEYNTDSIPKFIVITNLNLYIRLSNKINPSVKIKSRKWNNIFGNEINEEFEIK